jgi:hypothetical protein
VFTRFAVNSYQSPALSLSAQRVVNARTVPAQQGSRTQTPVFRLPGIKNALTAAGPIRGASLVGNTLVIVAGEGVYSVSDSHTATLLGSIPGTGYCPSAAGVDKAVFLADGDGYVVTTTVTPITDADFLPSTQVVWTDGYFVFLADDRIFVSDFGDPLNYQALAFDSISWAQQQPTAIIAEGRDLIQFGPRAMAIASNRGTIPYPFGLNSDGFIERGCLAPRSPAKLDQSVFWLADDRTVRVLRGNTPQRVSTEALEQLFARFDTLDDAFGLAISQDGTFSYVLTFPSEGRTFEYSVGTGLWNERASYGSDRWQVEGHIEAYGRQYVWSGNKLGYLDPETYTEWGDPQVVTLTSESLSAGPNWIHFDRVELDLDVGVGLITGQGSDPQIGLRYSDDGGKTWGTTYFRGVGKIGETRKRVPFTRHGRSRNRVYQLTYSDPTPFAFYGAWINEEQVLAA